MRIGFAIGAIGVSIGELSRDNPYLETDLDRQAVCFCSSKSENYLSRLPSKSDHFVQCAAQQDGSHHQVIPSRR